MRQASYGALYSVGAERHEIQEVNSEMTDSSDADVSSSGVPRSTVSGFQENRVDASAGINSDLIEEMGNFSVRIPPNPDYEDFDAAKNYNNDVTSNEQIEPP